MHSLFTWKKWKPNIFLFNQLINTYSELITLLRNWMRKNKVNRNYRKDRFLSQNRRMSAQMPQKYIYFAVYLSFWRISLGFSLDLLIFWTFDFDFDSKITKQTNKHKRTHAPQCDTHNSKRIFNINWDKAFFLPLY